MTPLPRHTPNGCGEAVRIQARPRERRVCATPGCDTLLSVYNEGNVCAQCMAQKRADNSGAPASAHGSAVTNAAPAPRDKEARKVSQKKTGPRRAVGETRRMVVEHLIALPGCTATQIAEALGVNRQVVAGYLRDFEAEGKVERLPGVRTQNGLTPDRWQTTKPAESSTTAPPPTAPAPDAPPEPPADDEAADPSLPPEGPPPFAGFPRTMSAVPTTMLELSVCPSVELRALRDLDGLDDDVRRRVLAAARELWG